jgi:predicted nucleic acid-binding protein
MLARIEHQGDTTMSDGPESVETREPDVGAILEQLRGEVRARRLTEGRAELSSVERELQRALDEIELHRVVSAHWPLYGKTPLQKAIALVNKLVRRYLRWYINPIVEQQNAYNDAVARTLRLLAEAYAELGEQIAENREPRTENREPRTENREPRTDAEIRRPGDRETTNDGRSTTDGSQFSTYGDLMTLVRERAAAEPPARFPDIALRAAEPHLRLREQVSAHWPLYGKTPLQKAIALVNKLVRRYLRWYVNPIVEQQNAGNAAFTVALSHLIALDSARRAEVARIRAGRGQGTGDTGQGTR